MPAGRLGDRAAVPLAERIGDLGLPLGRLKTGTPPRLDGRSIDWDAAGDAGRRRGAGAVLVPVARRRRRGRSPAASPHTNERPTRSSATTFALGDLRRPHRGRRAALLPLDRGQGGALRREGRRTRSSWSRRAWTTTTVYPNGISTSLPPEVQEAYVRTMQGLENAEDSSARLRHRVRLCRPAGARPRRSR